MECTSERRPAAHGGLPGIDPGRRLDCRLKGSVLHGPRLKDSGRQPELGPEFEDDGALDGRVGFDCKTRHRHGELDPLVSTTESNVGIAGKGYPAPTAACEANPEQDQRAPLAGPWPGHLPKDPGNLISWSTAPRA